VYCALTESARAGDRSRGAALQRTLAGGHEEKKGGKGKDDVTAGGNPRESRKATLPSRLFTESDFAGKRKSG